MTVTASITTQHGISVSLTVPAGRYRIIRRAALHRALVPTSPVRHPGLWSQLGTQLGTWLLHPDAERLHARRQVETALSAERERQSLDRPFLHFP